MLQSSPAYGAVRSRHLDRPFTRSQRLLVAKPPPQGRRSWPASSMPHWNFHRTRSASRSSAQSGEPQTGRDRYEKPVVQLRSGVLRGC